VIFIRFKPRRHIVRDKHLREVVIPEGAHSRQHSFARHSVPTHNAQTITVKRPGHPAGFTVSAPSPPSLAGRFNDSSANIATDPAPPRPFPPITGPISLSISKISTIASAPAPATARSAAISTFPTASSVIAPCVSPAATSTSLTRPSRTSPSSRMSPSTASSPTCEANTSPTTSTSQSAP